MNKHPFAFLIIVLMMIIFSISQSSGAQGTGEGGPTEGPLDTLPEESQAPFILTSLPGVKPMYWADTETPYTVIYDQWEIFLFGMEGQAFQILVNGILTHNDTLAGSWKNISFDASRIDNANINIRIGNESYTFQGLAIAHTEWVGGGGGPAAPQGQYFDTDLKKSQRNGAIGATALAIVGWIGMWFVVVWEHNRKGVSHE